ncbi:MAG TPA: spermidine synthase [Vicinamibacteria bacterium]|nr:spermidine synthase [Vicinamibacteria bacterium]
MNAPIVFLLFYLSGVAALVYQAAWQRVLALGSGVGIYSVAMIVGAFMAGLGIGSHVAGVRSAQISARRSLRSFALVELGIGLFGILSPFLLYDVLYARAAWLYAVPWRAGIAHFLTLLLPTGLMGMSLPFLVRGCVREAAQASRTIGNLYGVNVLGAATGAILTPWVLVRLFGLRGAVFTAAATNLVVGLAALWLAGRADGAAVSEPAKESRPGTEPPGAHSFALWMALYAVSGFVALALEILWFRIVDVAVKSSAFTFGTVLALYLLGCGAGALVGARIAARLARPLRVFLLCQASLTLVSALAVAAPVWLPSSRLGAFHDYWRLYEGVTLGESGAASMLLRLYVLLPVYLFGLPTFLMGLTFPILQRAVHDEPRTSGRKVGLLQAANIGGCVAGSFAVGLVALDRLGTSGTLRALCVVAAGFAALGWRQPGRTRVAFGALGGALVAMALLLPANDRLWARLHGWEPKDALLAEDASGVSAVLVEGGGQRFRVSVNGKGNSTLPFGSVHSFLGAIPVLIHPKPEDVAIIGLGSGDTAWAAGCRSDTRNLTVFELLRSQPPLLRELSSRYPYPPLRRLLDDPRLRLVLDDGRSRLEHEGRLYDMIEADALRPRSAGSGNVYSVEFFEACARRLKPGGIVCTWTPTPRVHESFARVFPHLLALTADGEPLLVGSREPLALDRGTWRARLESPEVRDYLGPELASKLVPMLRGAHRGDPGAHAAAGANLDLFPRDEFLSPAAAPARP